MVNRWDECPCESRNFLLHRLAVPDIIGRMTGTISIVRGAAVNPVHQGAYRHSIASICREVIDGIRAVLAQDGGQAQATPVVL